MSVHAAPSAPMRGALLTECEHLALKRAAGRAPKPRDAREQGCLTSALCQIDHALEGFAEKRAKGRRR